jgi:hypothetical protein
MKLKDLKTDKALESAGVEVEIFPGAFVTVRSNDSPEVNQYRIKMMSRFEKYLSVGGKLSAERNYELSAEVLANATLVTWRGDAICDENDVPIPFSKEKALEMLRDPEYRTFHNLIYEASKTPETFKRKQVVAAVMGNSEKSSNGSSSGEAV